jgi:hypothetical protein
MQVHLTRRRRVPLRRLALAVTGALFGCGLLASSALAAPTGSITIGLRINTGQSTAQFYSTSDLYDPEYGYALSWFPHATLAAPGEQCIAGSSAVKYVGSSTSGPGWQRSGTEAFYADAGTICLWVYAGGDDYLVASAAVPPKSTPAPPPTPAPAPPPPPTPALAADSPLPLSVSKARSAALAKAKQLWKAQKPKVVKVRRMKSSTVTVRVMWRRSGAKQIRTVKVARTRGLGVRASAA